MSDIHYSGDPNARSVSRFRKALGFLYEYSGTQEYPNMDALLIAGDMSNHGTEKQIGPFKRDLDAGIKAETKPLLCMGNHEFYGGSKELWQKTFDAPLEIHEVINGCHFIGFSPDRGTCGNGDYKGSLDWLERQLNEATQDAPDKPIFVFQHYPITGTVYGTLPDDNSSGIGDLYPLFQKYPKVIDFAGHSHYPINDPRSAWQDKFTAFGTGTLREFWVTPRKPGYSERPSGSSDAAQFYIVEVDEKGGVVLRLYDLITDSFFPFVYTVVEAGNLSEYLYTNNRYEKSTSPRWKENDRLDISEVHSLGAKFRFPQASDDAVMDYYRLSFERKIEDRWKDELNYHAFSDNFHRNMPDALDVPVYCLKPDSRYRVAVRAVNCFKKESEKTLNLEFSTPEAVLAAPDQDSPAPNGNILNVFFEKNEAVNRPTAEEMRKPVETFGAPKIENDSGSNTTVATFNGTSDAYVVRFTKEDYEKLQWQISVATRFRFEEFPQGRESSEIFANTEQGGYGFTLHHRKKCLEFWIRLGGDYRVLSHPVEPGKDVTAFAVYDGLELSLYVNGEIAVHREESGLIVYPDRDAARAFCIGGDITPHGRPANHFQGKIAFARVYSWPLRESQIREMSK